jgi:hypothetical protein
MPEDEKHLETDSLCPTCKHSMIALCVVDVPKKSSISRGFKMEKKEVIQAICTAKGLWPVPPLASVQACTEYEVGPEKKLWQAGDKETPKILQ